MSPDAPPWSLPKRIAFRYAFCWLLLVIGPALFKQLSGLNWVGWIIEKVVSTPQGWFTRLAAWLVGFTGPFEAAPNGSGDRSIDWVTRLGIFLFAAVLTLVWSAADRRPRRYDGLYGFLRTYARLWLANDLISYGLVKVFMLQMSPPGIPKFEERIGDASPMGLLWTLIGSSPGYEHFAGASECIAGLLLLWSRTSLAGALMASVVMSNVVLFNLCYDVPVKIFSSTLLLTSVFLCVRDAPQIIAVLRGHDAPAAPRWTPPSPRWARAAIAFEIVAALVVLGSRGWDIHEDLASQPPPNTVVLPIEGDWRVEKQVLDGQEIPGLLSASARWQTAKVTNYGIYGVGISGTRVDQSVESYYGKVDETAQAMNFTSKNAPAKTLTYKLDGDQLTFTDQEGKWVLVLRKLPKHEFLLQSTGFRWVNEQPFNR